jgi:hypothetical protein
MAEKIHISRDNRARARRGHSSILRGRTGVGDAIGANNSLKGLVASRPMRCIKLLFAAFSLGDFASSA